MRLRHVLWLQVTTHFGALMPLAVLMWMFWQGRLGPDPIGEAIRRTGRYALVFLILSLVPTAVKTIWGSTPFSTPSYTPSPLPGWTKGLISS